MLFLLQNVAQFWLRMLVVSPLHSSAEFETWKFQWIHMDSVNDAFVVHVVLFMALPQCESDVRDNEARRSIWRLLIRAEKGGDIGSQPIAISAVVVRLWAQIPCKLFFGTLHIQRTYPSSLMLADWLAGVHIRRQFVYGIHTIHMIARMKAMNSHPHNQWGWIRRPDKMCCFVSTRRASNGSFENSKQIQGTQSMKQKHA